MTSVVICVNRKGFVPCNPVPAVVRAVCAVGGSAADFLAQWLNNPHMWRSERVQSERTELNWTDSWFALYSLCNSTELASQFSSVQFSSVHLCRSVHTLKKRPKAIVDTRCGCPLSYAMHLLILNFNFNFNFTLSRVHRNSGHRVIVLTSSKLDLWNFQLIIGTPVTPIERKFRANFVLFLFSSSDPIQDRRVNRQVDGHDP